MFALALYNQSKYGGMTMGEKFNENLKEARIKKGLSQNRWPFELKNYSLQKKAVPFGTAFLYTFFMLKKENIHHYGFAFKGKEVLIDGR